MLRIWDVYPGPGLRISDPNFFHPGSKRFRITPDQNFLVSLTQKIVSKLSEIWSIPDTDLDIFLPIPDPGVKKAPDPGSGSATLEKSVKINLWSRQQDILRDPGLPGPWDPEHLRPTQRCLRSQGIHRVYFFILGFIERIFTQFYNVFRSGSVLRWLCAVCWSGSNSVEIVKIKFSVKHLFLFAVLNLLLFQLVSLVHLQNQCGCKCMRRVIK